MNDRQKISLAIFLYLLFLILLRLIPILIPESRAWGFNHLIFLPQGFTYGFFAIAIFILIIPLIKNSEEWGSRLVGWFSNAFFESPHHILYRIILALLMMSIFTVLAAPTHFLGEGYAVINNIISDSGIIYKWSEIGITWFIKLIGSVLGPRDEETVRLAFQGISIISGAISIYMIFFIAELMTSEGIKRVLIVSASILSGSLLLFFGYIEYYPLLWMFSIFLLYSGLRYLKQKHGLVFVWLFLLVGMTMHLQMIIFSPAVLYISLAEGKGLVFYQRFKKVIIGAIIAASAIFVFLFTYFYKSNLYIEDIFLPLFTGKPIDPDYAIFSIPHILDIFNQLILISPMIFLLILIGGGYARKIFANKTAIFLGLLAAASVIFLLVIDPKLAMSRDWDLFSLTVLSPTLLFIFLIDEDRGKMINRFLPALVMMSFISIAPFLMVNLSKDSSEKYMEYIIDSDRGKSLSSLAVLMGYYKLSGNDNKYDSLSAAYDRDYMNDRMLYDALQATVDGNLEEAVSYAKRIKPNKFNPAYHRLMSRINFLSGRYDEALDNINKAVQLRPYGALYYYDRALIFITFQKFEKAQADLHKAWKLDRTLTKAPDAIAYIYELMNRSDSCIYYAQETMKLDSTIFESYYKIVKSFVLMSRLDSAEIYMEKYARLAEADSSLLPNMGILNALIGNSR